MPLLKRNLILTNKSKNSSEMALLTIEKYNNTYNGTIKLYNIENDNLLLAISSSNKPIFNNAIKSENNVYTFSFNEPLNLNDKLTSVIVKKSDSEFIPIVWYSEDVKMQSKNGEQNITTFVKNTNFNANKTAWHELKKENVFSASSNNSPQNNSNSKSSVKNYNLDELFNIENDEEINKIIDDTLSDESNNFLNKETEKIKPKDSSGAIFYDLISEQIEDLFSKYPNEPNLEKLIPNSKWVLVEYEDTTNPYVLGLIYNDINLKYICYGIIGQYSENPPKDLENYSQWLPIDPDNVSAGGYWVMYQDALTGENIKIDLI